MPNTPPFKELLEYSIDENISKTIPELPKDTKEITLSFDRGTFLTSIISTDIYLREIELIKGLNPSNAGKISAFYLDVILDRTKEGLKNA